MKNIFYFLIFSSLFFNAPVYSQVEKVIVETYYVSDSVDATDTTGGGLSVGSKTYRIYIDMKPGTKLRKIYGDVNHKLKISSTDTFFNNKVDGQSFAKDIKINRYGENTVALDTWLTLGQAAKPGIKTYFGILKVQDTDGSIVGGTHNDGGSSGITNGLLTNTDPRAGIPLTTADGLDTMVNLPSSWGDYGIISSGIDSTIFGSVVKGTQFISNNAGLQNSGVMGVVPDSNQVLVAQLTTKGNISFELNVEVEEPATPTPKIVKYVANADTLLPGEFLNPFLKYPQACGCKDPNYLEYSPKYSCSISDSCKTHIIFGCTDSMACNYDPKANFNIPSLCCYPGYCNDRNLSVVCPLINSIHFGLYPNPAQERVTLQVISTDNEDAKYTIYDSFGRVVNEKNISVVSGNSDLQIDISKLATGFYMFRLFLGNSSENKIFFKN